MKLGGIGFDIVYPKVVWRPNGVWTFNAFTLEVKKGIKIFFGKKTASTIKFESHTIVWILFIEIGSS